MRKIGKGHPVFIIAEAGVNHNGNIKLARKLIDAAVLAGADAIKFQTFKTEEVLLPFARKAEYQVKTTAAGQTQFDMIKKLELTDENFIDLSKYARDKGIIFISTPDDIQSVDLLDKLNVPLFKIGSAEITNFVLLKHIASKKRPVILSTGMSTLSEIRQAVDTIRQQGVRDIILLHCVSSYPARIEDMNLRVILTLKDKFGLSVGFSDHSPGITAAVAAVALGACVIEKHLTLSKNMSGPDHKSSLEPGEFKNMVKAVREAEAALGNGKKQPTEDELKIRSLVRRSITASINIPKGAVITEEMLAMKRPGTGIPPKDLNRILGKKAARQIKKDTLLSMKYIARQ